MTIEEIVRQSRAAIAWLYESALSFGGDRRRIYVSGHSAGGHLTAMLALTDWEGDYALPADIIKGGCPISGLFDLRPFPYTYLQPKLQLTWGGDITKQPDTPSSRRGSAAARKLRGRRDAGATPPVGRLPDRLEV